MMGDDRTKQALAEMLTENVGRSFLDSGGTPKYDAGGKYIGSTGGYGRSFERQAGMTVADFDARPAATMDGLSATIDLYHWLADQLDYEPELTELYDKWSAMRPGQHSDLMVQFPAVMANYRRYEQEVPDWRERATEFWRAFREAEEEGEEYFHYSNAADLAAAEAELVAELDRAWILAVSMSHYPDDRPPEPDRVLSPWGDDSATAASAYYSYNEDNALSQDILIVPWRLDDGGSSYVLLQIHGGCDARGGFTSPRVFSPNGRYDDGRILDWARVSVQAGAEDAPYWDSDDGGCSYHTDIHADDGKWKSLRIDHKTTTVALVPVDLAPAVARVVAATYRDDDMSLIPTEMQPDLFGGESPMVVGDYPPDVRAALDYLDDVEGYNYGDFAVVMDDDGGAYCPVTGGKLEAWVW